MPGSNGAAFLAVNLITRFLSRVPRVYGDSLVSLGVSGTRMAVGMARRGLGLHFAVQSAGRLI